VIIKFWIIVLFMASQTGDRIPTIAIKTCKNCSRYSNDNYNLLKGRTNRWTLKIWHTKFIQLNLANAKAVDTCSNMRPIRSTTAIQQQLKNGFIKRQTVSGGDICKSVGKLDREEGQKGSRCNCSMQHVVSAGVAAKKTKGAHVA